MGVRTVGKRVLLSDLVYFCLVLALHAALFLAGSNAAEAQDRRGRDQNQVGCQQQFATPHLAPGAALRGYSRAVGRTSDLRHMHAVLVWGGDARRASQNYISHWNDLSLLYITLRNLGMPAARIHVLLGAGRDPRLPIQPQPGTSPGRRLGDPAGREESIPTDLDCDGRNDIDGPGTRSGLRNALLDVSETMGAQDRVLMVLLGHGTRLDTGRDPFETAYQLWNEPSITARQLNAMLADTLPRGAHIGLIATSCDSGGFIQVARDSANRCVITSGMSDEITYTGGSVGYTLLYRGMFGAIMRLDATRTEASIPHDRRLPLRGDANGDGALSLAEAYQTTAPHISSSTPQIVGGDACEAFRF